MNTIILLAFVAVIAFGFGVWSWIYISSKSPKIYELKPVIEQIVSDLVSLTRNLRKLLYLTGDVTQGILMSSRDEKEDSLKVFQEANIQRETNISEIHNIN